MFELSQSTSHMDLLAHPTTAVFFYFRDALTEFSVMRNVNERRAYHDELLRACGGFLAASQEPHAIAAIDALIGTLQTLSTRSTAASLSALRKAEPRGLELLGIDGRLTRSELRKRYRRAALAHHPDIGGGHEDMRHPVSPAAPAGTRQVALTWAATRSRRQWLRGR